MVTTRSSMTKAEAVRKDTTSKGPSEKTLAMRTKLDITINRFDKEFELYKAFIVKNLKIHKTVESQVRRVIKTRERTFRLFEEWRDQLDKQRLQLVELYVVRDSAMMELRDLEAEAIPDLEEIADLEVEIADLTTNIDQILLDEAEIERNIRRIKTIFTDVERCLQTYKVDHETIHSRLCQKLAVIARSRHRAIAQRRVLGTTKNGKKI